MNLTIKAFLRELAAKADGMSEGVDADGGYAVGTDVASAVMDRIFQEQMYTAMPSRFLVGIGKNKIKIPILLDPLQSAPTANATRAYWQEEAAAIDLSVPKLGGPTLNLKSLVVLVPATNELVEDVANIEEHFIGWGGKAIQRKLASEMVFGTGAVAGVGNLGTGSAATLTTTVSTVPSDAQLQTMFGLLHPSAVCGARYYVSHTCYQALYAASGYTSIDKTMGRLTVMGIPVEVNPYLLAATPNHIILGNFSGYALAYKDPKLAKSLSVYYLTNQQAFRIVLRIAGDAQTVNSPCEDTVTRAYFVIPSR